MGYAVTNPATGETLKTYDTITDAELEAAIAAATGVLLEERELFEILFYVKNRRGFIGVSDGEHLVAHFEGPDAMAEARLYAIENS